MKALENKLTAMGVSESAAHAMGRALLVLAFTLATAAGAHIEVPVPGTVVPMTLQTAVVLFAGLSLGRRDGALSQALYVGAGLLGLPFFATTGVLGATFGYLIGFVFAAWFAGSIPTHGSFVRAWLVAFAASLLIFLPGVVWLKSFTGTDWAQAFTMGVVPFIIGDFVKVTAAATAHMIWRR